jgi:hypothetical protein
MPNEKWLHDEPKSWHDVNRALQDISVLMEYLAALPEGRLLSYFTDTQNQVSSASPKITLPPCATYPEFLNRLAEINSAFQSGTAPSLAAAATDGKPMLSPIGFIYWSRDFLAAAAAPATADSIRLTHDYVVRRARFSDRWRRWYGALRGKDREPKPMPQLPPDPDETTRKLLARRLAVRVRNYEWITMAVVALTVGVSIYALSGRLILGREKLAQDAFAAIDAQIQAQEDKIFPSAQLPMDGKPVMPVVSLCSFTQHHPVLTATSLASGNEVKVADLSGGTVGPASTLDQAAAKSPVEEQTFYVSALQAHLCPTRDKVLQSLFVVTMHLQSWSSLVTQGFSGGFRLGFGSYSTHVPDLLAPLFGVVNSTLSDYATENNGAICSIAAPGMVSGRPDSAECRRVLLRLINRSRNVSESILGSITQYILPVLYGFLGSMAAAMRLLRRKVDASLLSFTDRSRLQQGAILGVLCGGVIGLFANYVGSAETAGGLGLSALALLAGYNVDGVFRFLDELSERIFRPVQPAKPG